MSALKPGEIKLINVKIKSEDFNRSKIKKPFISFMLLSPKGNYVEFLYGIMKIQENNTSMKDELWNLHQVKI